jgi:outer membrane immunogenic protein
MRGKIMTKKHLLTAAAVIALALPAGSALAADLAPVFKAPPPPPPMWTGFYAGLNLGWAWGRNDEVACPIDNEGGSHACFTSPTSTDPSGVISIARFSSSHPSGVIGGGQFGYNYQLDSNWVLGFEADIQGANIEGSFTDRFATPSTFTERTDWLATVRGRVGYLFTPNLLVYGTAGLAYGGVEATASNVFGTSIAHFEGSRTGWTAGGGVEWLVTRNLSVKGEALYYDLGSVSVFPGWDVKFDGVILRAGLNFHFDWLGLGKAPIRAAY